MSEQISRPRSQRLRAKQQTPSKAKKPQAKSSSLSKQRATPKKGTPLKSSGGAKRALSFGVALSQAHGSPGTTRSPGKLAFQIAERHNEVSEATGVTNHEVYLVQKFLFFTPQPCA